MGSLIQSMSLWGAINIAARRHPAPSLKLLSFIKTLASDLAAAPYGMVPDALKYEVPMVSRNDAGGPSDSLAFQ